MASINTKTIVQAVLVVGIAALVLGVLLPVALSAVADDVGTTITQDNGTTLELKPGLDSTLNGVNTSNATYTLALDGNTDTNTIDVGSVVTYTLGGDTVDVGLESTDTAATPDTATANYTYDQSVGYSSGAQSLWNILDLAIVLGAFLFIVGMAMKFRDRV